MISVIATGVTGIRDSLTTLTLSSIAANVGDTIIVGYIRAADAAGGNFSTLKWNALTMSNIDGSNSTFTTIISTTYEIGAYFKFVTAAATGDIVLTTTATGANSRAISAAIIRGTPALINTSLVSDDICIGASASASASASSGLLLGQQTGFANVQYALLGTAGPTTDTAAVWMPPFTKLQRGGITGATAVTLTDAFSINRNAGFYSAIATGFTAANLGIATVSFKLSTENPEAMVSRASPNINEIPHTVSPNTAPPPVWSDRVNQWLPPAQQGRGRGR